MKMQDLAETPAEIKTVEKIAKKQPYYPSMYFNDRQMKSVKGLSVGDRIMFHAEGVVTSYSESKTGCSANVEFRRGGISMKSSNAKDLDEAYYEAREELKEEE